jgi:hypothetical protein
LQARPLFENSYDQLDRQARSKWNDANELKMIFDELGFRNRPKPRQLRERIGKRLDELGRTAADHAGQAEGASAARIAALEFKLRSCEADLQQWKARCARAEAAAKRAADPLADLYARIWLTVDCPDFVFDTVRRIVLREHHPDRASNSADKKRMEEEFKRFGSIFDRIAEERK